MRVVDEEVKRGQVAGWAAPRIRLMETALKGLINLSKGTDGCLARFRV
jgi:hypothetical protein